MPGSRRSLAVTQAFQQRIFATRQRLEQQARRLWPTIDRLDQTDWPKRMAAVTAQAQAEAVRATSGYLSAFLTTETGRRTQGPTVDSRAYSGLSRDGRLLVEAFESPLIGVKAKLKEGVPPMEALAYGLNRGTRMVGVDFDHAHRQALLDAIDQDPRFDGWQRVTTGTCGACAAAAGKVQHGLMFQVHPGCHCVSEPQVVGVATRFPRPTGAELFAAKSESEQDDMLGPDTAAKVRAGEIEISELAEQSELDSDQPGFITQRAT